MSNEQKLRDYLTRASADLQRSRLRVTELESAAIEPIALVGISCRYPGGVSSPEELWAMLEGGVDGITPLPRDRNWDLPEDTAVTAGGFLFVVAEIDAGFFVFLL